MISFFLGGGGGVTIFQQYVLGSALENFPKSKTVYNGDHQKVSVCTSLGESVLNGSFTVVCIFW